MKVMLVSSKYPPEYSGSGLRAHRTYLRLNQKFDIDFEVVSSSTESSDPIQYQIDDISVDRILAKRTRNIDRKLAKSPLRKFSNAALIQIEANAVKRKLHRSKFDLIHTFGYSPATIAAVNYSRDNKIPLLMELVNPMPNPFQYMPGRRRFKPQDLRTQSGIVAIGKSLGDMCESHGLTNNVWVRPNPVDVDRFSVPSNAEKLAARSKISAASETDVLVVYVAKYIARKNHRFLLDVIAKLPKNFRLILAGPPLTDRDLVPGLTAEQIPTLDRRAKELGISDRVEISHGFVDMAEYLAAADVFCFPAEREAMGTPVLESISSGVPVVANADESSFREWITDDKNGYLNTLDAGNWAHSIMKAVEFNQEQKTAMSEDIKSLISTDLIDNQYSQLINAVASATAGQQIDVDQVLSS
jgi:glycosyltransferase involved in cell wall biosynthesis